MGGWEVSCPDVYEVNLIEGCLLLSGIFLSSSMSSFILA